MPRRQDENRTKSKVGEKKKNIHELTDLLSMNYPRVCSPCNYKPLAICKMWVMLSKRYQNNCNYLIDRINFCYILNKF